MQLISNAMEIVEQKIFLNSFNSDISEQMIEQLTILPEKFSWAHTKFNKNKLLNLKKKPTVNKIKTSSKKMTFLPGSIKSLGLENLSNMDKLKRNNRLIVFLLKSFPGFNRFAKLNNIDEKYILKVSLYFYKRLLIG